MKTILAKLCLALLFSGAAARFTSAAEPAFIPKMFSAYIGGFMGASYRLELHDSALSYTSFDPGHRSPKQTTITPTSAQWREFRQTLDDLRIWQWRTEYATTGTSDGTQWSLDITYPDRTLKTKGDNNYPDDAGKPNGTPDPTKAFKRYLAAIQKLIGGKAFE